MKDSNSSRTMKKRYFISGFLVIGMFISAPVVFGHGGKHAAGDFTHLQALKKAMGLYDQLIAKGKLDQTWEGGLKQVEISRRRKNGKEEVVVSFQRAEGDPKAVYIFFTADGKYSGSNFTGN